MALLAFQQALCELIASPGLCLAVRDDAAPFLGRYELSPRERERLQDVVWQRGMSTTCSLHRSNRVTPLYTLLHYTCVVLGPNFQRLLDAYWADAELRDLEFKHEIYRFASFVKERLTSGALDDPFVREILDFELAVNELRFAPRRKIMEQVGDTEPAGAVHPLVRVVRFDHDPAEVLTSLARGVVPRGLPPSESYLVLNAIGEELSVVAVDPETARALTRSES